MLFKTMDQRISRVLTEKRGEHSGQRNKLSWKQKSQEGVAAVILGVLGKKA